MMYKYWVFYFPSDRAVRICTNGACSWSTAGAAKGMDAASIEAVFAQKGDDQMTKALTPTVETLGESMKGLDAQKAVSTWRQVVLKLFEFVK